jgi:type IV pilus assembly protein PilM
MRNQRKHKEERSILSFFPPPSFISMSAAGVDISDSSIKFMEFGRRGGHVEVTNFSHFPIAKGLVENGEVKKADDLAKIISSVVQNLSTRFVHASLPEEMAYLFQTQAPGGTSHEEILNIVEFKLEEHVPISANEAVFDYELLNSQHSEADKHLDLGVVAYPKKTVEDYTNVFYSSGITPLSFEVETQALGRAVVPNGDLGTYIIIDFGEKKTGLAIVSEGSVRFSSTLDVGGDILTNAIKKEYGMTGEEAARAKSEQELLTMNNNTELRKIYETMLSELKRELDRHYRYWHARKDDAGTRMMDIQKVILCGGNANIVGLPEFLSSGLKLPVERGNVWVNAFSLGDYVPSIDFSHSLTYATAIGLALRGVI